MDGAGVKVPEPSSTILILIAFNHLFVFYKDAGYGHLPKYLYYLSSKEKKSQYARTRLSILRLNGIELMSLFKLLCVQPIFEYVSCTCTN